MNQMSIGRFISDTRKAKGLTQRELANLLNLSDKTISKWETGKGFPDVSSIIPLCDYLDINPTELLSGRRLNEEAYMTESQEQILYFLNEQKENQKKRRIFWLLGAVVICNTSILSFLSDYLETAKSPLVPWLTTYMIVSFVLGLGISGFLYFDAEVYRCSLCRSCLKPDLKTWLSLTYMKTMIKDRDWGLLYWGPQSRPFTCPHCHQVNRCQRLLAHQEGE